LLRGVQLGNLQLQDMKTPLNQTITKLEEMG